MLLSLDDCLYALQATISQLTHSSLHRCLERHGISCLPEVEGDQPRRKKFDTYLIGFFHIDLAEVRTAEGKLYLFVAIDCTSKFAVVKLVEKADMRAAAAFLQALVEAAPYRIHSVLNDNGIQFADLPKNRKGPIARFRGHPFDRLCLLHAIEHRLTKPSHPWINGQVERRNRTIKDATVKRYFYERVSELTAQAGYVMGCGQIRGMPPLTRCFAADSVRSWRCVERQSTLPLRRDAALPISAVYPRRIEQMRDMGQQAALLKDSRA